MKNFLSSLLLLAAIMVFKAQSKNIEPFSKLAVIFLNNLIC